MSTTQARRLVDQLHADLERLHDRDPEQEVRGMAVPVLDAAVEMLRGTLPADDAVVRAVRDIISPDALEVGEPIRAADALLVVGVLKSRIGPEPPASASARPITAARIRLSDL